MSTTLIVRDAILAVQGAPDGRKDAREHLAERLEEVARMAAPSTEECLEVLLSDTVGFIEKLPHHLVASFHATMEEVRQAKLLLHVVDAGSPSMRGHIDTVERVLFEARLLFLYRFGLVDPGLVVVRL